MSGYMRVSVADWQDEEHYGRDWTEAVPASPSWVRRDLAWYVETRRPLPSVTEASRAWGWRSRERVARVIRECVEAQASWEARPDRKEAILSTLLEWAAKAPKTKRRTGGEPVVTTAQNRKRTGDHGITPRSHERGEQETNRRRT